MNSYKLLTPGPLTNNRYRQKRDDGGPLYMG